MDGDDEGDEIPPSDLRDPETRRQIEELTRQAKKEVSRLIAGREMSRDRASAVKRIVRRVRQLMGQDAPNARLLKWWAAEMLGNLDGASGMVKHMILRTVAESIGLLKPGGGLTKEKASSTFVPTVRFEPIKTKPAEFKLLENKELPKLANASSQLPAVTVTPVSPSVKHDAQA